MEYLIAVDLEGIHGVIGEANHTLTDSFDYKDSVEGAQLEVNAAARALFDNGATKVAVWDNHGGGGNLDFSKIDERVIRIDAKGDSFRYDFVKRFNFKGIIFLGYHAKEGTPGGVLAHTFSSKAIQYVKLNGKPVGELTVDSYICESHGFSPIFAASDDIALREITELYPNIAAVITKYGKSRNRAELRDRESVLSDIYNGVSAAVKSISPTCAAPFSSPAKLEVRYTRAERAEEIFEKAKSGVAPEVNYGDDTHILHFEIQAANQIPKLL